MIAPFIRRRYYCLSIGKSTERSRDVGTSVQGLPEDAFIRFFMDFKIIGVNQRVFVRSPYNLQEFVKSVGSRQSNSQSLLLCNQSRGDSMKPSQYYNQPNRSARREQVRGLSGRVPTHENDKSCLRSPLPPCSRPRYGDPFLGLEHI
jgi:hypothetical protein